MLPVRAADTHYGGAVYGVKLLDFVFAKLQGYCDDRIHRLRSRKSLKTLCRCAGFSPMLYRVRS